MEAGISLYNTLTRRVEPLATREPGRVRMYVCGVTVYDLAHIGHARCYVVFDALVRFLEWTGTEVVYVRNITDIDDKIIDRANASGKTAAELGAEMAGAFQSDVARLCPRVPDVEPRATAHVAEMIEIVSELERRGVAYRADGDVYFDVSRFAEYGKLSHRRLDEMLAGARVEVVGHKRQPADFVLWKGAKPGEPTWDSPFGPGRPGWHIECSAMSVKYRGQPFDLHGGGEDLVFPHHENEIAQSEAATGVEFLRHWMHVAFLRINAEKMSKSLGNFVTIREAMERHPVEALRFMLLQTHYRSPLEFSDEAVAEAQRGLVRLYETLARALTAASTPAPDAPDATACRVEFRAALADDFNTPRAIAALHDGVRAANRLLDAGKPAEARAVADALRATGAVLGILQGDPEATLAGWREARAAEAGLSEAEIEGLIGLRNDARKARDFAAADRIRDRLVQAGIDLKDRPDGTTGWTLRR
ncbi:MAG: cysteine--tRNA ligase [Alphaproteobacteria bacterium]